MSGTEGAWHRSWLSSSSCLVLDHSSLSRWETSSWSEGPAHWVAPCNKSDIRDSNKRQFYEDLKLSMISFTPNFAVDGNPIMAFLRGHFGPILCNLTFIKTSSLEITPTWSFSEIRISHRPTLPVCGECLRADQRRGLSRDLLAVSVRKEEEE